MDEEKHIVIISDGTGRTARRLMDAVLIQYSEKDIEFSLVNTFQQVRDQAAVDKIMEEIEDDFLVIFSIISDELVAYLGQQLSKRGIISLNVLQPMLDVTSKFLGVHPDYMPGKLQIINDRYYEKIDAIGYAVRHDDGLGYNVHRADLVLVGISRTCKTPVSMYLACNYGLKVANIPVVRDAGMTEKLLHHLSKVPPGRIIGLLMQPDILALIREDRSVLMLGDSASRGDLADYYDVREVTQEYRFSNQLFEARGWKTVDVTRRAIEEISQEILDYFNGKS